MDTVPDLKQWISQIRLALYFFCPKHFQPASGFLFTKTLLLLLTPQGYGLRILHSTNTTSWQQHLSAFWLTPVEENDDTNAVLSYMCGYQGTQYLSLGIVKIARAWSVLIRLCAFNDGWFSLCCLIEVNLQRYSSGTSKIASIRFNGIIDAYGRYQ